MITQLARKKTTLLIILIALFLSAEYICLGPSSYVRVHDEGDAFIGRNISISHNLKDWIGSYWYPNVACGVDRLGNDIRLNHLPATLYYILPGWLAYQTGIFLLFFISMFFTYRLCTDILGLSLEAGLLAGLSYSVYIENFTYYLPYAAFPLVLWLLEKTLTARLPARMLMVIVMGLVYSVSSSLPLSIPFCLFLVAVWIVFVRRKTSFADIMTVSLFCIVCIIPHIRVAMAVLSNNAESHRAVWGIWSVHENILLEPLRTATLIFKNPVAFLLTCAGIVIYKNQNRNFSWCVALVLFCTLGAAGIKTIEFICRELPLIGSVKLYRFYLLYPFFISITAAYTVNYLLDVYKSPIKSNLKKYVKPIVYLSFAFLILVNCASKAENLLLWMNGSFRTNYMNKTLATISAEKKNDIFRVVTLFDEPGFTSAYNFETADGYVAFYTQRYKKFWGKVIEPSMLQDSKADEYFQTFGSRVYLCVPDTIAFNHKDTVELNRFFRLDMLSLINTRYVFSRRMLKHDNLVELPQNNLRWYNIDNRFKRILTRTLEENIQGKNRYFIYVNNAYLPRFFTAGNLVLFDSSDALLNKMAESDISYLKATVLLEKEFEESMPVPEPGNEERKVNIEKYSYDNIELVIHPGKTTILVATNSFSKYWKCFIDGTETTIVPAYSAFWGVSIPENDKDSNVEFKYMPPYGN